MDRRETLRARKLIFCLLRPNLWGALRWGVAPSIEHTEALLNRECDYVIDVGANRGQFALAVHHFWPDVEVVSFEPLPEEAAVFQEILGENKRIRLHQIALGEYSGVSQIHVSQSPDSSSLLPIGALQTRLFPKTYEKGTLSVAVEPLDKFRDLWEGSSRIFLKIDVQGFELSVLKGAVSTLQQCAYVYVECSHVELYLGQPLFQEIEKFLEEYGFVLELRLNEISYAGKSIQADYLFRKELTDRRYPD